VSWSLLVAAANAEAKVVERLFKFFMVESRLRVK